MTQKAELIHGDCLVALRAMPSNSIDAVVTDPPYGLSFMGKRWDYDVPAVEIWAECLRVLKPGGHLLAFAGTRTQHRMAVRIEDAGFEIRDMIAWVYGSGFPKSLNVQQAMNKAAAGFPQGGRDPRSPNSGKFKTGCTDENPSGRGFGAGAGAFMAEAGSGRGDDQGPWQGWGTALKPALEPITVARKPLDGTVAQNVLTHGTGAINVDGCRVPTTDSLGGGAEKAETSAKFANEGWRRPWMENPAMLEAQAARIRANVARSEALGRWPANLIHDGSDEVVGLFPRTTSGSRKAGEYGVAGSDQVYGARGLAPMPALNGDSGSAARFFYCAKASKRDRDEDNSHPTVKPTELMAYLCRLVTPPGGVVLDPFMGSGSTGKAALREGFMFVGIERDEGYFKIAEARINDAAANENWRLL